MSVGLPHDEPKPAAGRSDSQRLQAKHRERTAAVAAATAIGIAMVCAGLAAVSWIELYIQARDPAWNAIPWTPLCWSAVGAGIVILAVTEAYVRWPGLTAAGFIRARTHNQTGIGRAVWAAAAALGAFEVINRTWLGYYSNSATHPPGSWTEWHRDPAAIAMFVLVYFGLWWEAGRLGRTGLRLTVRGVLFPGLPLLAVLVILFALAMAMGGSGGFSPSY